MPVGGSQRACPLCGTMVVTPWRQELLNCETCGLVVAGDVWRSTANEQLNAEFFDDDHESGQSGWVRLFENWSNGRTWRRLRAAGSPACGRLLEVGVGSGSL